MVRWQKKKKEKFESSYPKGVRIAAIIGVIFLVALYIVTLIAVNHHIKGGTGIV